MTTEAAAVKVDENARSTSAPAAGGAAAAQPTASCASGPRKTQRPTSGIPVLNVVLAGAAGLVVTLAAWLIWGRRGKKDQQAGSKGSDPTDGRGPLSRLKATSRCVPLADGLECVVRREIPGDNSCLFNAVGYCMHHSKTKASHLRSVVAREVSSKPEAYTPVFLGMQNAEYCQWIETRTNWGGAIELSILVQHYNREISAWNVETTKSHTFGEEAGFPKQVMVIYTGTHYDSLAIAKGPKAPHGDDITEFNPRTKRGKMILAAAAKLCELTHRGSPFYTPKVKCTTCAAVCKNQREATRHAEQTGHTGFEQVALKAKAKKK